MILPSTALGQLGRHSGRIKSRIPQANVQQYTIMDACFSVQASKCMKSLKLSQKGMQSALKELAAKEAKESAGKKFAFIHKRDADADYINTFMHEISDPDLLVCLVVGDDKLGPCQMAMAGPEKALKEVGPK